MRTDPRYVVRFVAGWLCVVGAAGALGLALPGWLPPEQSALVRAILACSPWWNLAPAVLAVAVALAIAVRRMAVALAPEGRLPDAATRRQLLIGLAVLFGSLGLGAVGMFRASAGLACA